MPFPECNILSMIFGVRKSRELWIFLRCPFDFSPVPLPFPAQAGQKSSQLSTYYEVTADFLNFSSITYTLGKKGQILFHEIRAEANKRNVSNTARWL